MRKPLIISAAALVVICIVFHHGARRTQGLGRQDDAKRPSVDQADSSPATPESHPSTAQPARESAVGQRPATANERPAGAARAPHASDSILLRPANSIVFGPGKAGPLYGRAATRDPLDIALRWLADPPDKAGFPAMNPGELIVNSRYRSTHNGVTHFTLRQHVQGIELADGYVQVNLAGDGSILSVHSRALPMLHRRVPPITPQISPEQAVAAAADFLRLPLREALVQLEAPSGPDRQTTLSDGGIAREHIPVKLQFRLDALDQLQLVWNVQIEPADAQHYWNMRVAADNGAVLDAEDWVVSETYHAYPAPLIDPSHGDTHAIVDPHLDSPTAASPFGWHDTNGTGGAEFTITRGNNVHAYEDSASLNASSGNEPDGGPALVFSSPADLTQEPATYADASVINLFYWNNLLHDIHYAYGFDEASGNFQQHNYGTGGSAGDPVLAESQDGAGFNNANMLTLPDGASPRMQLFLGTYSAPMRDGALDNGVVIHEYGHGVSTRLTGGPGAAGCLIAVQSAGMGEGWSDWWSLALTATAGDAPDAARPVGTWLFGQPSDGPGIRSHPYSTDMSVNPLTFGDIATASRPHGIGTVWCSILWEVHWKLVDRHGFDPDMYSGLGGNNIAMLLVTDGLKLQPCNPTFIDARDAILLADEINNGGANRDILWQAFAKRGLGTDASAGSGPDDVSVSEGFEAPEIPLQVIHCIPGTQSALTAVPSSVTLAFNADVDPAYLSANGLTLGGFPASAAEALSAETVVYQFVPQPSLPQGTAVLRLASNAVHRSSDGAPVQDWQATLRLDYEPLHVLTSSPPTGATVELPFDSLVLTFNEPLDPDSLAPGSLLPSIGVCTGATLSASNAITFHLSGIDMEGPLTIRLLAGAVADVHGNPGEAFLGDWELDFGVTPEPAGNQPGGSAHAQYSGTISDSADIDSFAFALQSNDILSAVAISSGDLWPNLELHGPDNSVLAAQPVDEPGNALLQTVRIAQSGTYQLRLAAAAGHSGAYEIRVWRNAAVEEETYLPVENDDIASAQSLDSGFVQASNGERRAELIGYAGFPGFSEPTVFFNEDFDDGIGAFAIDNGFGSGNGLWHLSSGRAADGQAGHSPPGSIYFGHSESAAGGGTYEMGAAVGGAIVSSLISLPLADRLELSFSYLLDTESFAQWDHATVQVDDGTGFVSLLDNAGGGLPRVNDGQWRAAAADLTPYAGQTIRLRFSFDTFDDILNNYEGWYVDDIQLTRADLTAGERDFYSFVLNDGESGFLELIAQTEGAVRLDLFHGDGVALATGVKLNATTRRIDDLAIPGGAALVAAVAGADIDYALTLNMQNMVETNTPAFHVAGVYPSNGSILSAPPSEITLHLDRTVRLDTVDPSDLAVNAVPATTVSAGDGDTLVFGIAPLEDGQQNIVVSPGAFVSLDGREVESCQSAFTLDRVPPVVVATLPEESGQLNGPDIELTVAFSEPIAGANIGYEDFMLVDQVTGEQVPAHVASLENGDTSMSFEYRGVDEGSHTLTLLSGNGRFEDHAGLDLDGDGSGAPGGDFSLTFHVDSDVAAMPTPFKPHAPLGSLVYDSVTAGSITPIGDADAFTFSVDAGQCVSAVIEPGTTLRPSLELYDSSGTVVTTETASAYGAPVAVTMPASDTPATNSVKVYGAFGSTGAYTLRVFLNGMPEAESLALGSNESPATAENLDGLFESLGGSPGRHAAVCGTYGGDDTDTDWYRVTVPSNSSVCAALGSGGNATLDLFDGEGNSLIRGGELHGDAIVCPVYAPSPGESCTLRVSGSGATYTLMVLLDSTFDTESGGNDSAIPLGPARTAVGAIGNDSSAEDAADEYAFAATAGEDLVIATETPGGGALEFLNTLDPALELYDPIGTLVAIDDNTAADGRNALLTHTTATSGTYRVIVKAQTETRGEYVLHFDAPAPRHLAVLSEYGRANPAQGRHEVAIGTRLSLNVTNSALRLPGSESHAACVGWSGSGSVPAAGDGSMAGPLMLFEDSSITWQWRVVEPNYVQDFEDWDMDWAAPDSSFNYWQIHDGYVWHFFGAHAGVNAAWLYNSAGELTNAYLRLPDLTGGLHALIFQSLSRHADAIPFEIQISEDGAHWSTYASLVATGRMIWVEHVVTFPDVNPVHLRIAKPLETGYAQILGIDDVVIVTPYEPVVPDADADGLPDVWELLHGLDFADDGSGNAAHGADGDADADGASNTREWEAGTDPLDPASVFAITTIELMHGGAITIRVRTEPGHRYTILYSDQGIGSSEWNPFSNPANAIGTWHETRDEPSDFSFYDDFTSATSGAPSPSGRRCYRVRVE